MAALSEVGGHEMEQAGGECDGPALERLSSSPHGEAVSHLEYSLIRLMFGFSRWVEACMGTANVHGLNSLDILVLHAVNHRARGCRLSQVCMVLNVDDSHLISYALKKLANAGLIVAERHGRERHYTTTEVGDRACFDYRRVRDNFFVDPHFGELDDLGQINKVAERLTSLASLYDRAVRDATIASARLPKLPPVRTKR